MNDDSVSAWLEQIKAGDRHSVGELLERYFQRLTELADARLRNSPHLDGYEEDVALSAFKSLCIGAEFEDYGSRRFFSEQFNGIRLRRPKQCANEKYGLQPSLWQDVPVPEY